jgi:mutator protein MutT
MKEILTTLVFLRRDTELLLAMKKRGHGEGHWNGAGGKVDPPETIEQAMIRECEEEIGVTPVSYEQVALQIFHQLYKGEPSKNIVHVYICTGWRGEPTESEEMAPQWFEIKDIPYAHMWPDDRYWLPQVLSGQKLHSTFYYDDDYQLLSSEITEVESFDES